MDASTQGKGGACRSKSRIKSTPNRERFVHLQELYAAPEELSARHLLPAAAAASEASAHGGSGFGASAVATGRAGSQGLGSSSDSLTGAVPAPGATGRLPSGALPPLHGGLPLPAISLQRTPAADMFSLGLLLLQLLHPLGGGGTGSTGSSGSSGGRDDGSAGPSSSTVDALAALAAAAASPAAEQTRRMLQDARHQILPSSLVQVCHLGLGWCIQTTAVKRLHPLGVQQSLSTGCTMPWLDMA